MIVTLSWETWGFRGPKSRVLRLLTSMSNWPALVWNQVLHQWMLWWTALVAVVTFNVPGSRCRQLGWKQRTFWWHGNGLKSTDSNWFKLIQGPQASLVIIKASRFLVSFASWFLISPWGDCTCWVGSRSKVAESKGLSDTVTYMAFLGSCRNLKSKLHAKAAFNKLKEHADKPALASAYVLMHLRQKFRTWQELKQMDFQISFQTIWRRLDTTTATVYVAPRRCIELEMCVWCLTLFVILLESGCLAVLDVPSAPYRANFVKVSSGSTDSAFVIHDWVTLPGAGRWSLWCKVRALRASWARGKSPWLRGGTPQSWPGETTRGILLALGRPGVRSTAPPCSFKDRFSFDFHCFHWFRVRVLELSTHVTTCDHWWPLVNMVITVARDMCRCVCVCVLCHGARWWLANLCGGCWKPWGESHHRWLQCQNQGRWLQALWAGSLCWQHKWLEGSCKRCMNDTWTSSNMIDTSNVSPCFKCIRYKFNSPRARGQIFLRHLPVMILMKQKNDRSLVILKRKLSLWPWAWRVRMNPSVSPRTSEFVGSLDSGFAWCALQRGHRFQAVPFVSTPE